MKQYCLNKKELRYLTNQFNNDLMGIGYSLGTDAQEELRIQESLLSKDYAVSDFDCSFSVEAGLASLLNECNQWSKIVHFSSTSLDRDDAFDRFFIIQNTVVHEMRKGDAVCIERADKTVIINKMAQFFSVQDMDVGEDDSFLVNAKRIEILSQLRKERLVREIKNEGCSDRLGNYIADALTGRGEYASVVIIERTPTDIQIQKKLTVCWLEEMVLIIHPEHNNGKQCIRFELGSQTKLEMELTTLRSAI